MNKKILFTPIGGTDPMPETNYHDGSMLHISRVYKPDKVILYMSKEICEKHRMDNRYIYSLEKLAQFQNRHMEFETIEKDDLENVQEFDFFYNEFTDIIRKIISSMDESDELILNISSGAPAMKSALFVLTALGEFKCKFIQVTTPERKMNEHIHKEYDVEMFWEMNEDNEENFANRCVEAECPSLIKLKNEQIIINHVLSYDYSAALSVAEIMNKEDVEKYEWVLKLADARLHLEFSTADKHMKNWEPCFLPIRDSFGRKSFEYALTLDIKLRRKEYADFARAITPLLVDLFDMVLSKSCGIDIDSYSYIDTKSGRKWDKKKLQNTEIDEVLNKSYSKVFEYGAVNSDSIVNLICAFSTDAAIKEVVTDLRKVESGEKGTNRKGLRNLAAHEIASISEESMINMTGFTGKQIMKKIRTAFNYTSINVKSDYWNSYDDMNKRIIEIISE